MFSIDAPGWLAVGGLMDTSGFPPRWLCGTGWTKPLGWAHIISDVIIWLSYFAIPCLIIYYVRRRRDAQFLKVYWLFGAFIFACGHTHLIEAVIFWEPVYRLSAAVKMITAAVSLATVVALVPVLPRALALPGLASVNARLTQEIAARKRSEREAHERNRDLEMIINAIAHDLKTPIRTINAYSEILAEQLQHSQGPKPESAGAGDPEAGDPEAGDPEAGDPEAPGPEPVECLPRIRNAAVRLNHQLEDLIVLAQVQGRWPDGQAVNLTTQVAAALNHLQEQAQQTGATIQVADDLPVVWAVPEWLNLALVNLLSNAIKFTPADQTPQIQIQAAHDPARRLAGIKVLDRGVGLQTESTQRIFKLFKRDAPIDIPGTGAGLAIVQRVAERQNGRVWAEPRPGGGAVFTLLIPLPPPPEAPAPAPRTPGSDARKPR